MLYRKKTLIAGDRKPRRYLPVDLVEDLPGKVIEGVETGSIDGEYGPEPCVWLLFADGTYHGFVIAAEQEA